MPEQCRLLVLDEIDSTNEEARRRAAGGEAGGLWIVARRQSAGRGRRGRSWISAPGNLFCSVLLRPHSTGREISNLSFVAAVALHEAFVACLGEEVPVACEWPNDVLLGDSKVAGILLESSRAGQAAADWAVIGFGVNLVDAPELRAQGFASIEGLGIEPPSPAEFLAPLSAAFDRWQRRWEEEGFEPVRAAWLERASGPGRRILVHLGDEVMRGRFEELSPQGALILRLADGRRKEILAADVLFDREGE